jgi:CheY-like chemotaxis protein
LQGGEIGVASEAGRGSIFAFYVRARRSAQPANTEEQFPELVKAITAETKAKRSGSLRLKDAPLLEDHSANRAAGARRAAIAVLIVEDNLVNQKVLQKQLRNKGFHVEVANHGGECLDRLRESHFWSKHQDGKREPLSVILMDQEMPVMDGLECTKKIREWEKDGSLARHVPIIGVTANARAEQIQTLLVAGMVRNLLCLVISIVRILIDDCRTTLFRSLSVYQRSCQRSRKCARGTARQ